MCLLMRSFLITWARQTARHCKMEEIGIRWKITGKKKVEAAKA
jgi:hypothetical protein